MVLLVVHLAKKAPGLTSVCENHISTNRGHFGLRPGKFQPSPFDKLRAGSAGLSLEMKLSRRLFSPWGASLLSSVANSAAEGDDFAVNVSKSVPQGLKPDVFSIIYGPTKVVP
jgi:hypothetical protein